MWISEKEIMLNSIVAHEPKSEVKPISNAYVISNNNPMIRILIINISRN